jgi:hypothetical protein
MAKRKIRPHPGVLSELLKSKKMTWTAATEDAARGTKVIDRKTLTKIDRGEEVKLETLENLAKQLGVPTSYFDPPANNSVSQLEEHPGSVMLRKVDAKGLADLLKGSIRYQWQLNVHQVDDEAVAFLGQLEGAVNELDLYFQETNYRRFVATTNIRGSNPRFELAEQAEYLAAIKYLGSLSQQLDGLKFFKRVANLFEELPKHRLAILGAEFLCWECTHINRGLESADPDSVAEDLGNWYFFDNYVSFTTALISIDEYSVQTRRGTVDRTSKIRAGPQNQNHRERPPAGVRPSCGPGLL